MVCRDFMGALEAISRSTLQSVRGVWRVVVPGSRASPIYTRLCSRFQKFEDMALVHIRHLTLNERHHRIGAQAL